MGALEEDDPAIDPAIDRRIAEARPDLDSVTRAVWQARIAAALFGEGGGGAGGAAVTVGRYRLQRQLGRGGGGSVYVAADPELDRDVAVKLIRTASARHRDRALAEGRALARLSHPNVVPVHDVGETATHVYLVMELLRGDSLRLFAAARPSVRELVGAYRQAASGLAAAHAVGLVHRDFKPDNAMFGDDGRLRVVDFGLAVEAGAEDPGAVGTPRYMAPEQRAGRGDAAVDQYALGVALREAVTAGDRAAPAWLARVIARATAEAPAERYPSMEALAAALGDDPRSRWRRRALIAVPVALAIGGFWIGRGATVGPAAVAACGGGADALAPAWSRARVDAVVARIGGLGTPFAAATAPLVRDRLDRLGAGWLDAHRRACTAHERGELSTELYDRATVCLARSRLGIGEVVELLGGAAAAELDTAVAALAIVDRGEPCADPLVLAAEANPQPTAITRAVDQQIELAAVHARAATPRAVALGTEAVAAARGLGDRALLARALLALGHACMVSDFDAAVGPLHEAMLVATEEGLAAVAAEAYARHVFARGFSRRAPERPGLGDGVELARALALRAGDRGTFARALLANNAGALAMRDGDFAAARAHYGEALHAAAAVTGPGRAELTAVITNVAMLTPDPAERRRLYDRATAQVEDAVGPDHPDAITAQFRAVGNLAEPEAAAGALARLCRRMVTIHPDLDVLIAECARELAWQATALDRAELVRAAIALYRERPSRPSVSQQTRRLLDAYAIAIDGAAGSRALLDELADLARAQTAQITAPHSLQHVFAADLELASAVVARATGDRRAAAAAAARAIAHLEPYGAVVPGGLITRRLAWARALRRRLDDEQ